MGLGECYYGSSHLWSPCQSIGRAELTALVSTVRWGLLETQAEVHVWSDSQHIALGAAFVQNTGVIPHTWEHQDLWLGLSAALDASEVGQFYFHWVPSHLDERHCESPFEDWLRKWNDVADRIAGYMNSNRPSQVLALFERVAAYDICWRHRQEHLLQFIVSAGDLRTTEEEHIETVISSDTDSGLPPTLTTALVTTGDLQVEPGRLPPAFYKELVGWLRRSGGPESRRTVCSFLEFVFLYAFVDSGLFPFEEVGGRRVMRQVQDLFVRPTVTTMVDMVRVALTDLCRQLDVDFVRVLSGVLLSLGIHTPMFGIPIDLNPSHLDLGRRLLRRWTSSRPIRRAADLARPFSDT